MKTLIYDYMVAKGGIGISFVELSRDIPGFKGDKGWEVKPNSNIFLWHALSPEAAAALATLLKEQLITCEPTSSLTYVVDALVPGLPVAKQDRTYKEPHWLPVTFSVK